MRETLKTSREYFEQGFKNCLLAKGANILHFSIMSCLADFRFVSDSDSKEIVSTLKLLPNLEHLKLKLRFIEISEKVTMNKLKSLKTQNVDLLKFIDAPKLHKLGIITNHETHENNFVVEHLRKLTNLKQLLLDGDLLNFAKNEIGFSFELKELKFNGCTLNRWIQDKSLVENFMRFLRQQKKTLVNLQIPKCFPSILVREIFMTFETIKWLHLDPISLPTDENFYLTLKPMRNVWFIIGNGWIVVSATMVLQKLFTPCFQSEKLRSRKRWSGEYKLVEKILLYLNEVAFQP